MATSRNGTSADNFNKSSNNEESEMESVPDQEYKPEVNNELLIKPVCSCKNCHHWTNSVDWCTTPHLQFEQNENKKVLNERKIQPLLKSSKYPGKTPKIFTFNCKEGKTRIERQELFNLLIHGTTIPQPVQKLTDTYFDDEIQTTLKHLNFKYSFPIQSFIWPAIFRQLNVCIISKPVSGKTMAYLPAICTFALKSEKYQEFSKYKGPLVVIICPTSKHCEQIFDLIRKLYENIRQKPKVCIMTYPINHINSVDILIILPNTLLECLKSRIFNMKKLCHLVLEDASTLLKNSEENMYKILNVVNEMLEHRENNAKVQLIITSEKWSSGIKKLLQSIYSTPLVCIGDHLEASLYGNTQIEIKFLMSEQKKTFLEGILKNKYNIYKTLIICKDEEVNEVNEWLIHKGIETVALTEESSKEDIETAEEMWSYTPGGRYKVILSADSVFDNFLSINDAMWLIHYSLPSNWRKFTKRFGVFLSECKSPLEPNGEKVYCKSFLMIDETCEQEMLRILNLLNRVSKNLPPTCQQYADNYRVNHENKKILNEINLCDTLKLFGKCSNSLCAKRHVVSDDVDISDILPKNGKIVFRILEIKDVTQYYIQLIEHIDLEGNVTKIDDGDLQNPLIYDSKIAKKPVENLQIGKFYGYCEYTTEGEVFKLCQVLSITNEVSLEVKLANGLRLVTLRKKLFHLPRHVKIVEIYLSNLIPPFNDEYFSARSFHVTRNSLESLDYKDLILTGDICLQLNEIFWLNNVVQLVKAGNTNIVKFNLTKHLLNLQVVEMCKTQLSSLYKLCAKNGITLPCYSKPTVKKVVKVKEIEPQRSFLDENVAEVILSSAVTPDEFYVRLAKYQDLLQNLENDINHAVNNEILDKNVNPVIGKYYLALDPRGEIFSRVMILNIKDDVALCFYVDYGDEAVIKISELKNLPTKFITKLPFQAIQCCLHGIRPAFGEWDDSSTDVLYKYLFEPNSDIFRSLYVQVRDKEKSDSIRAKVKYSVLLKDGYGNKNTLINQLLLDCGYASSDFDKVEDFELPEQNIEESSSDSDSGSDPEEANARNEILMQIEDDNFEVEVMDAEEFLQMFAPSSLQNIINSQTPAENENSNGAISAIEYNKNPEEKEQLEISSNFLTPEVFWSQSDKTIKLKIKLIGVERYKTNVIQRRIFTFWTNLEGKIYELKFPMHKVAEMDRHYATGQEVLVYLNKVEPVEWLQLTKSKKRMRNIHYEVPEEAKEQKRKFLQLDITDDESDGEDNIMFHEVSDLDSEFDQEAVDSSD